MADADQNAGKDASDDTVDTASATGYADAFRAALGSFPTGVTVVTTLSDDGDAVGMTVNSFNSVSLNPPLILWSLLRTATNMATYEHSKRFAINVLTDEQAQLSNRFAVPMDDRFAGVATTEGLGRVPLLQGCAAWFECSTWANYDGGDHTIIVGHVDRFRRTDRSPLVFAKGKYESLGREKRLGVSADSWGVKEEGVKED